MSFTHVMATFLGPASGDADGDFCFLLVFLVMVFLRSTSERRQAKGLLMERLSPLLLM